MATILNVNAGVHT